MLISRGLPFFRNVLLMPAKGRLARVPVRNSSVDGYRYRGQGYPEHSDVKERTADICYTIFWWWVCYCFITKYDMITGEYPYPDSSAWTDEELGVPPDDYEPPSRS